MLLDYAAVAWLEVPLYCHTGNSRITCYFFSGITPPEDKSQKYVSDFLERYVLDSDTDSEGRRIPIIKPSPKAYEESHR